jgi:sulfite reductase alpha subunit-like flavoprotein
MASPRRFSPIGLSRARCSTSTSRRRTVSRCPTIRRRRSSWSVPAPASRRSARSCTTAGRTGATGRNWLFFGHQRSDCDFFYADELNAMKTSGLLTRLSLAWSRDGAEKFYVQDRMREVGRDLWSWLADGAHLYICGDAKRMAKDVERALVDIVAQCGARSTDEAVLFVSELKKKGRFQQDVY